jgi:hypothetical protein
MIGYEAFKFRDVTSIDSCHGGGKQLVERL